MSSELAAIYCRLSEEDKRKEREWEESRSIHNQKEMLVQYAGDRGWKVYDIYSDEAYAGADRRRPEFNRLLRDAKAGAFQIILCKSQSRFTREMELVEKYIHGLFPLWGIRFVSVADHGDSANKGNKKARQINGLVNEWYLEDLSDNIKTVLDNRRRQGFHIGATALYGYKKDAEHRGHLLVDGEAADVVRRIFLLYINGMGKTTIARLLNQEGVLSPSEYKKQQSGRGGKMMENKAKVLWSYETISHMLKNEMYTGVMVQGKFGSESYKTKRNRPRPPSCWYRVEGTHEAIVEKDVWERAQRLQETGKRPGKKGQPGIFAGKVRCKCCGHILRSHKTGERRYLRCPVRLADKNACPGAFVPVDALERAVYEEIKKQAEYYVDMPSQKNVDKAEDMWMPEKLTKEMVDILVEDIRVGTKNQSTGEIPVELHWKM